MMLVEFVCLSWDLCRLSGVLNFSVALGSQRAVPQSAQEELFLRSCLRYLDPLFDDLGNW